MITMTIIYFIRRHLLQLKKKKELASSLAASTVIA